MVRGALLSIAMVAACAASAKAQQATSDLTDSQKLGQRLFTQHCGVCHLRIQINTPDTYGPPLSKANFENGREAQLKGFIANGTPNMPAFKYQFDSAQIDAIVDFLKTKNAPAASTSNSSRGSAGQPREKNNAASAPVDD